jgi:hypothetical protein
MRIFLCYADACSGEELSGWTGSSRMVCLTPASRLLPLPETHEHVYRAICPHRNHRHDKMGRPIYIEHSGRIRVAHLLKHRTAEDLIRRHIRQQVSLMFPLMRVTPSSRRSWRRDFAECPQSAESLLRTRLDRLGFLVVKF